MANEVTKKKSQLLEKRKQVPREAAKMLVLKIKERIEEESSRTPASPELKRKEKSNEKMVEEPSNEVGKGRKNQYGHHRL